MAETAEMKQALAALEKAIIVLREGTKPSSFLQQGTTASNAVKAVIEALPVSAPLKPKHAALLGEFAEMREGGKFAPQSWTVQGILRDMYDTFSADLESATETEADRNRKFELFIAQKVQQLKAMQAQKAKKEGLKAAAEELLADTTQMYDDTEGQMKADIAFFDKTKAACESKHSEWITRSELRTEELDGIKKALKILTTDAARELFASTIKAGKETGMDDSYDTGVGNLVFFQVATESAYRPLRDAARKVGSLRLAALAVRVQEAKVGHFDAVLKEIDVMIQTLRDEDAADIAKRDQCKSEYQKIASTIANVNWLIEKNNAKIDKLTRLIQELTEEKAKTIKEIDEVEAHMAAITTERKAENAAFLQSKKDDQDAITLLASARTALLAYYSNRSIELGPIQGSVKGLALAQQGPDFEVSADQAPEAVFSHKGKRKDEAKGIVQLLSMIMEDLNDEIKNDMKAEEVAQLEYEQQMTAANKLKDQLTAKKINLIDMIGKRTQEKSNEEADLLANQADLKDEQDYKAKITPDCDWIIGAFSERAARRVAEMNGLVGAKEYLAAYQPPALVEKKHSGFDDSVLADINFHGLKQ
mmetsp:Transcript_98718/g.304228  ORF Transcript_98718/g.304228 Transcript_98718/m.304228 type:complete len:591 (-) Transcript_98718:64-1836(-)